MTGEFIGEMSKNLMPHAVSTGMMLHSVAKRGEGLIDDLSPRVSRIKKSIIRLLP
jgi:hypothetical protein